MKKMKLVKASIIVIFSVFSSFSLVLAEYSLTENKSVNINYLPSSVVQTANLKMEFL